MLSAAPFFVSSKVTAFLGHYLNVCRLRAIYAQYRLRMPVVGTWLKWGNP